MQSEAMQTRSESFGDRILTTPLALPHRLEVEVRKFCVAGFHQLCPISTDHQKLCQCKSLPSVWQSVLTNLAATIQELCRTRAPADGHLDSARVRAYASRIARTDDAGIFDAIAQSRYRQGAGLAPGTQCFTRSTAVDDIRGYGGLPRINRGGECDAGTGISRSCRCNGRSPWQISEVAAACQR